MKHLKEYKLWEQSRELTTEQEGFLNRYVKGTWRINSEGLVDVEGDFDCESNPISDQTIELICQKMRENPEVRYGAILASLQNRIPQEDWEKLDKSSLDKMNQSRKRVYGMLGGIGGI